MFKSSKAISRVLQMLVGLMMLPGIAYSLGFGNLSVNSKLGEPLRVQIDLLSVTPQELGTLEVGLASRSDFTNAGLAYPENAALLIFDITETDDGSYVLNISTADPVNQTFLHFMLSANWSGGKVVREFTALLDPPLYTGESAPDVQVVTTTAVGSSSDTATATDSATTASSTATGVSSVTVQRGDTLSGIVNSLGLPSSVNMYQALTALVDANPEAFVDGNMNRLKAGAVLSIPDASAISQISRQVARDNFRSQAKAFDQYLTSIGYQPVYQTGNAAQPSQQAAAPVEEPEEQAEVAEEVAESVGQEEQGEADEVVDLSAVQPVTEPDEAVDDSARLSIAQQSSEQEVVSAIEGEQGEDAQLEALKNQLAELDESLLASGVENEEVQRRLQEIQEQVDRVSSLIEVEDTDLAAAQQRAAGGEVVVMNEDDEEELALAVVDETAQVDEGGEQGLADSGNAVATNQGTETGAAGSEETALAQSTVTPVAEPEQGQDSGAETAAVTAAATGNSTAGNNSQTASTQTASTNEPAQPEQQQTAVTAENTGDGGETSRVVKSSGILDSITGIFGSFSDYALKIVAALVVILAGIFFYRRRKSQQEFEESMLDIESEQISTNTAENSFRSLGATSGIDLASGDSGLELTIGGGMSYLSEDGIAGVAEEENEVVQAGAVDPLAEADVYLAYDRDEQAIQVLKEAYDQNPERHELAEKLLEIYHKQDDRIAFDKLAPELRSRIGAKQHPIWNKVVEMGREVSPENTLYQDSMEMDVTSETVDLELETAPPGTMVGADDEQPDMMDLDLGGLDIPSGLSEDSAIRELEIDDLDMPLGEPAPDRTLDAPTLSQIITAAEAKEAQPPEPDSEMEEGQSDDITLTMGDLDDSGKAVEFDLGDDDDDDADAAMMLDGDSELSQALRELEQEKADEVAEEVEDVPVVAEIQEEEPEVEPVDDALELSLDELSEDSYLSDLSEQSISKAEPYHEAETALELAKAYLELGEKDIAKGFIEEVINEGSDQQRAKAEKLVKELVD